ncbi:glutaredoxin family protein [Methylomonas fluvii]|uniref:Glutaredoxin family protein n=1 Tax=Methylomonas fluvii TaxID=1854564 RepID=A0ABR9D9A6_9GAMM|nr:glutaredoxin family protein [Methylomonas fluvii]MBD9359336.1 glutaredoxin family protein [Methylomonas fluvii]
MAEFILFGTEGCHLCEEAEALLVVAGLDFTSRDIMDNEQWQGKYGLLIPVLWHAPSQKQLNWPFDSLQLKAFSIVVDTSEYPSASRT